MGEGRASKQARATARVGSGEHRVVESTPRSTRRASPPLRILLVDDNADAREIYGEYLRLAGLHVVVAADGESAIHLALAVGPDVVIMDLSMPGISGCEAVRRLTADLPGAGMAIIAFSADDSDGTREAARAAGCCEFVAKPCPPDQLLDIVRGVHARHALCPACPT